MHVLMRVGAVARGAVTGVLHSVVNEVCMRLHRAGAGRHQHVGLVGATSVRAQHQWGRTRLNEGMAQEQATADLMLMIFSLISLVKCLVVVAVQDRSVELIYCTVLICH